ncbi:sigma-70 family RNA polymerase sigma factor [Acrocarpospora catenulata]|uniref:sigma-70 family RNA polymerase sigma factor n=1 Tax=Acrocarpospora catenulata TaxID=2836182 RepID=UPI001BDAE3B6|nr:sigma-70 family RNA polymerase sigma factor [Acrocarpospora catenulata]
MARSTKTRRDAHERIYARYGKRVLAVCLAHLDPERAQDAAQESFLVLMDALARNGGPEPGKLGPWLYGVARNKVRETYRDRRVTVIELPEEADTVPEWIGAADDQASEARRRAEVLRLLDIVASGLTERQRRIYWLTVREELRGQALANALDVAPAEANRLNSEVRKLMTDGFGCFLLADYTQFQWRYGQAAATCQGLLQVIRAWSLEHGLWTGKTFPALLRQQVSQHVRDCAACSDGRRRVVRPYLPGLIPVLFLPALSERMRELFARVSAEDPLRQGDQQTAPNRFPWHEHGQREAPPRAPRGRRPRPRARRTNRSLGAGLAAAAIVVLLIGGVLAWMGTAPPPSPSAAANETPLAPDADAPPSGGTAADPTQPGDPGRPSDVPSESVPPSDPTQPGDPGQEPNPPQPGPGRLTFSGKLLQLGQQYDITMDGFGAGEKIGISGDPSRATAPDVTADRSGRAVAHLTVGSDVQAKNYTVTAKGRGTGTTATGTVAVVATPAGKTPTVGTISFSAPLLGRGQSYDVTLAGFGASEDIVIEGAPSTDTPTGRTDSAGSGTIRLAVGQEAAAKKYDVTARGRQSGTVAKGTVTVLVPALTAPPDGIAPGETVTVTGTGFPPSTTITLTFSPGDQSRTVATDCCSESFRVDSPPLTAPGTYTITATGAGFSAQARVTVHPPACRPTLTLTTRTVRHPASGLFAAYDETISVLSATGFPAGAAVTFSGIAGDGTKSTIRTVTADQNGNASIDTPSSPDTFVASASGCEEARIVVPRYYPRLH